MKKSIKSVIIIISSIIIVCANFNLTFRYCNDTKESQNYSEKPIEKRNIVVSSRSETNVRSPKDEKNIFLLKADKYEVYFENLEEANEYKNYIIENTVGLEINIQNIITYSLDNITEESKKNEIKDNLINIYKPEEVIEEPIITTSFPTVSHKVTSTYGNRARGDFHTGIDLSGSYGDNIYAYKDGIVIKTQYSNSSYGNMILLQHSDGIQTRYAHLSAINVKTNQQVSCGEIIGYEGSTGNSTGVHLHFEIIINNKTVNPYSYIF